MRLKKIILHNVRSYTDTEIDFPGGSLLLSGEAGSGKSSILQSVEFALFGPGKGKDGISMDSLLRRGKEEAFVQLFFSLDGKEIEIKRSIKRKASKIQQSEGHITVNGHTEKLSADELRTRVLQLFNYPLEFVKKGKGLPFHYTVYTQQEQMKSILLEGADLRLNTLRRVFGVDKYKIIKENSDIFSSALRDSIKEKEGVISDLLDKQEQLRVKEQNRRENAQELEKVEKELEKAKKELESQKKELEKHEVEIEEARKNKEMLVAKQTEMQSSKERVTRKVQEITVLAEEIAKAQIGKFDEQAFSDLTAKIKDLNELARQKEVEIRNLIQASSKAETKKDSASELKEKITRVDVCPECGQKVTEEHKHEIDDKANREIKDAEGKIKEILSLKQRKEQEKEKSEQERQQLEAREKELRELKIRTDTLKEKQERKERLEKEKQELAARIVEIEKEITSLVELVEKVKEKEDVYRKTKEKYELLREREKDFEVKTVSGARLIKIIDSDLALLREEIAKKEKAKQNMLYLKELREWISKDFTEILLKIEQSVLATLHSQFDSLMKKWFSMLIDEPEISVRLDSEFSPIVEQAGYDTDYSHLSGGERTAVALAYRLALNQVINSLISQIKTKDLLILDEPTEGFSHSQLDRMRNVFQGLQLKQLIIISHNPKMEGFVDNIIRIRKEGHVSKVA